MHFFSPSALLHQVADFAFVGHHVAPKSTGTLSSHGGGGGHGVAASHSFLHFFFCFLHCFFVSAPLQSSKAPLQAPLQVSELLHGGGAGGDDGDDGGGGGDGGGQRGAHNFLHARTSGS